MNFKLLKEDLYTDRQKCLDSAVREKKISGENPEGFIYSCKRINNPSAGESINHAYKSETPVWITGCEYVADIYAQYTHKDEELKY